MRPHIQQQPQQQKLVKAQKHIQLKRIDCLHRYSRKQVERSHNKKQMRNLEFLKAQIPYNCKVNTLVECIVNNH